MSPTLIALQRAGDALAVAQALTGLIQAAQMAGRELTEEEVDAAELDATAAAQRAREKAQQARMAGQTGPA